MVLYIEVFLFMAYVIYVAAQYDILPSISQSWYEMDRDKPLFTFFCVSVGALHLGHGGVLFFLSGACLVFVGVATRFKPKRTTEYYIHMGGAVMAIVLSVVSLLISGIWWPAVAILILALAVRRDENATWWVEIFSFLFIIMGIAQIQ